MKRTRLTRRLGKYPEEREVMVEVHIFWFIWWPVAFWRGVDKFDEQLAFEWMNDKHQPDEIRDLR